MSSLCVRVSSPGSLAAPCGPVARQGGQTWELAVCRFERKQLTVSMWPWDELLTGPR